MVREDRRRSVGEARLEDQADFSSPVFLTRWLVKEHGELCLQFATV